MSAPITLFYVKVIDCKGNQSFNGLYITKRYYDGKVRYCCDSYSKPLMFTLDDIMELYQDSYQGLGDINKNSIYQVEPIRLNNQTCCCQCCCKR